MATSPRTSSPTPSTSSARGSTRSRASRVSLAVAARWRRRGYHVPGALLHVQRGARAHVRRVRAHHHRARGRARRARGGTRSPGVHRMLPSHTRYVDLTTRRCGTPTSTGRSTARGPSCGARRAASASCRAIRRAIVHPSMRPPRGHGAENKKKNNTEPLQTFFVHGGTPALHVSPALPPTTSRAYCGTAPATGRGTADVTTTTVTRAPGCTPSDPEVREDDRDGPINPAPNMNRRRPPRGTRGGAHLTRCGNQRPLANTAPRRVRNRVSSAWGTWMTPTRPTQNVGSTGGPTGRR